MADIIASPISRLINKSFLTCIFPDVLKEAKIIPIHKKGSKQEVGNYRPISLLPALSKIWEKAINIQLTEKMDEMEVISDTQFGFRKGRNTIHAIQKLVQDIQRNKRNGKKCAAVFIDITKAFDCCDHKIMLSKLDNIGLNERGLKLMENYLKNRKQSVFIKGEQSKNTEIKLGVGQGTILGPTLFKVYIHDFQRNMKHMIIQFADDTTLLVSADSIEQLKIEIETELTLILGWFKSNGLTVHPGKTRIITFGNDTVDVLIDNILITKCGSNEPEKSFNLLGIELDNKLNWDHQIQKIDAKISKAKYMLSTYRKSLNIESRKLLYYAYVDSHLRYGISLWGNTRGHSLHKLKIKQKSIVRMLEVGRYHTEPIMKKNKILKIADMYKLEMTKNAWEYFGLKLPKPICKNVERRNILHNTRNMEEVIVPRGITNRDRCQFDILFCRFLNNMRQDVISINTKGTLIFKMKKRLLNNYSGEVICNMPTCCECNYL